MKKTYYYCIIYMVGSMDDRNKMNFFKYLKDNDIVRKYQIIFDKLFNFDSLELINDKEIAEIMCEDEIKSIVKLYEIVNSVKISEDIKSYIFSLDNIEVMKYCLRLAVNISFYSTDKMKEYIYALGNSNPDVVRYNYGIASSQIYIEKEDGVYFVKEYGKCNERLAFNLLDILYSDCYKDDIYLLEFIKTVREINDKNVIDYINCLVEIQNFSIEKISLKEMIKLIQEKQKILIKGKI